MPILELTFASKEDSLSVRSFSIREEMSALFDVSIVARSELDDIDLESIVGKGATFTIVSGVAHLAAATRAWTGICSNMELARVEPTGLSTYVLTIVPALWRTTLRRNNRIFQHVSIPEIVGKVLTEWKIEPELRIDAGQYLKFEYRVQYGETDFAFLNRLLEEAGIAYFFVHEAASGDGPPPPTKLVLSDKPQAGSPRAGGALPFHDSPSQAAEREFVTKVRLAQRVRPGRVTLRDFDFRNRLDYQLIAEARAASAAEDAYEHYHYAPGAFLVEPGKGGDTPVADDKGIARVDEKEGGKLAARTLDAERRGRRNVVYETNVIDLAPGCLMSIVPHPRKDIADRKLLVVASSLEGAPGEEWTMRGETVFADAVYRPERRTARPRIQGVQSAVVVGPAGEEIHTDEFGRVRVQFHWDREGTYNDGSSCWIRVSQAWAGSGHGLLNIPRVGQEVLVEFFDGDPDRPVVVGRVFNTTRRVPYKLPDNKTKSGWKTDSSPGAGGFNELSFEDAKGREVIHFQAQKDFTELIKNDQSSTVLNNRSASVTASDSVTVGGSQSFSVDESQSHTIGKAQNNNIGASRASVIKESDSIDAGDSLRGTVGPGVGYTFNKDQTIVITNGVSSIALGPMGISIATKGGLTLNADGVVRIKGKEVFIDGGPNVYINCDQKTPATVLTIPPATAPSKPGGPGTGGESSDPSSKLGGHGKVAPPGGFEEATLKQIATELPATPAAAAAVLKLPAPVAAAITQAVSGASPVAGLAQASQSLLTPDGLKQGLDLAQTVSAAVQSKGASLLQAPALQGVLGSVITQPIVGGLSGQDLAGLFDQGQKLGIFHVGGAGAAAVSAVSGGAGAPGLGAGVQQFLALRTQTAPAALDGARLTADIARGGAAGLSAPQAQATALASQGIALFHGDGAGTFTKIALFGGAGN